MIYTKYLLILDFAVTGCVSVSAFASLVSSNCKFWIDSSISHKEVVSTNNVLKEYDHMKKKKSKVLINMFNIVGQILYLFFSICIIKSIKNLIEPL